MHQESCHVESYDIWISFPRGFEVAFWHGKGSLVIQIMTSVTTEDVLYVTRPLHHRLHLRKARTLVRISNVHEMNILRQQGLAAILKPSTM